MSFVFSAFTAAYAMFEMPTAWWADRIGSRRVLTRIVLWWSAFTMLTAAMFSYSVDAGGAISIRGGRSGSVAQRRARILALDSAARARPRARNLLRRRAPGGRTDAGEWSRGSRCICPGGWSSCCSDSSDWRGRRSGIAGFATSLASIPSVNAAEVEMIETNARACLRRTTAGGPWSEVFRIPSMLPLCLQYVANSYGYYFFITWLPTYLIESARHVARPSWRFSPDFR